MTTAELLGTFAALFLTFAIQANLLLGVIATNQSSMNLTALFGAVAGFSERLVPSLIKQIEEHISVRDLLTEPVQVKEVQNEPVQKKKQPRLGRHK